MIEELGGTLGPLMRFALDAALARHDVLAHNIANASTPGFIRKDLDFQAAVRSVLPSAAATDTPAAMKSRIAATQERMEDYIVKRSEGSLEVDEEMLELTKNVIYYRSILNAMSKRGSIIMAAVQEGRSR